MWRNVTTTSLTLFSYMTSGLFQENWVRRLSEVTHMWHTAVNVWEALTGHFLCPQGVTPETHLFAVKPPECYWISLWSWRLIPCGSSRLWLSGHVSVSGILLSHWLLLQLLARKLRKFVRSRALGIASGNFTRRRFEMWITLLCLIYLMWLWCDCTKHLY